MAWRRCLKFSGPAINGSRNGRGSVDPQKFDAIVRKLSQRLSRRAAVGGSISASLLTVAGLVEETFAKNKPHKDGDGSGGDGHKQARGGDGHGGGGGHGGRAGGHCAG